MNTYEIFNPNTPILDDNALQTGKTGAEALRSYLKQRNINVKVKVAAEHVTFSVQKIIERDGRKYRSGRVTWYKIID